MIQACRGGTLRRLSPALLAVWALAALAPTARGQAPPGAVVVSPEVEAHAQSPRWSPWGERLAWELNHLAERRVDLWLFSPTTGVQAVRAGPRPGSSLTAGFATTSDTAPLSSELSWSPAAQGTFVYTGSTPERDLDLHLASGSRLAPAPGADGGAAWSPDGRWIVFTSARTGQGDLYLLDTQASGKPPRRLTSDPTAAELYAAWSPDSRTIAYVGHSPQGDRVYVLDDLDNPQPRAVSTLDGAQLRPSFAPDGRHLAFYNNAEDPARFDLVLVGAAGPPRVVVRGVVLNPLGPRFTPDGQRVVAVLDEDARFNPVVITSVAGGAAKPVPTRTVGNQDHDVVGDRQGRAWLAIAAQGELRGSDRDWRRIYVMELPGP